ncbi:hypothetical protein SteCoe_400 [Stentor coeruleus]|uniref:Uncharacterized protein n=1 Tax=Stentor coeruleus TaxID=5963 RepID=A0A1R2D439_9CILI|nr:hypothetical protein SteCoe_400 [Stentor coeruleus]
MLVNNKFRPPLEIVEACPIKKNHDYYKTTGNLWDSKYLTSPKISKYYHDIQQTFLTGQNNPYSLSLKNPPEQLFSNDKTFNSKQHLGHLKQNSTKIQNSLSKSNGKNDDSISSLKKTFYNKPITPNNAWERLNSLPASKLRHVIPQKIIEKDLQGIKSIMAKSQELDKLRDWHEKQKERKMLKVKLANINRHNDLKDLEIRCGINKVREKNCEEGTFGYIRIHKTRKRTEELSKPRTALKNNSFMHEDFRGLLHADFEEAISKVKSVVIKKKTTTIPKNSKNPSVDKESLFDLDEFEDKIIRPQNSNFTSIEVMNFDIAKDFFK